MTLSLRRGSSSSLENHGTQSMDPPVIVTVAGAFNLKMATLSTARPHFDRLRHSLANRTQLPVEKPIVPVFLGMCSIDMVYRQFENDVNQVLENRGPNSRPYFVAHSLGGELALRYALTHPQTAGVLTAGTPHRTMRHSVLDILNIRTGSLGRFAEETVEAMQQGGNKPEALTFIGSSVDHSVPWEDTMPPIEDAGRFGFTHDGHMPRSLLGALPIRTDRISHLNLIHSHQAVDFIAENVASSIALQAAASAQPALLSATS
jgi:pimeloyl-ACP methyl ester carboxylesterase